MDARSPNSIAVCLTRAGKQRHPPSRNHMTGCSCGRGPGSRGSASQDRPRCCASRAGSSGGRVVGRLGWRSDLPGGLGATDHSRWGGIGQMGYGAGAVDLQHAVRHDGPASERGLDWAPRGRAGGLRQRAAWSRPSSCSPAAGVRAGERRGGCCRATARASGRWRGAGT